ncbi:adenylyl-sulfate kinase [Paracidovorax valerianellae]
MGTSQPSDATIGGRRKPSAVATHSAATVDRLPACRPTEHTGMNLSAHPRTVWLTGLSGAGKTTLANAFAHQLKSHGTACTVLDGDALRNGLNASLGFTQADRSENIRRTAEVARLFNDAGLWVVAALISPHDEDRQRVREIVGHDRCRLVWVRTPLAVCEARDPKGLYARARSGCLPGFTGVGATYEEPWDADFEIDTTGASVQECVQALWTAQGPVQAG